MERDIHNTMYCLYRGVFSLEVLERPEHEGEAIEEDGQDQSNGDPPSGGAGHGARTERGEGRGRVGRRQRCGSDKGTRVVKVGQGSIGREQLTSNRRVSRAGKLNMRVHEKIRVHIHIS